MFNTLRRSVILTIVLAVAAFPMVAADLGNPTIDNHSWGGYHWARTANPFTLKLGNNLTTSDWSSHLSQSSADWNNGSSPLKTVIVAGTSGGRKCPMVAGTTQVCNYTYGHVSWIGLASINLQSGTKHITQGTAKMNDTYFNTSTYNNPNEREHVMCQEVAHTFGLDHQSTDGGSLNTCMDYFSNTGSNAGSTASTKPNAHDYAELSTIYTHLDSTTTLSSTFGNFTSLALQDSADAVGDTPDTWGHVIEATMDGHTTTYEKDLSNGDKVVTYVIWATQGEVDRHDRPVRNDE